MVLHSVYVCIHQSLHDCTQYVPLGSCFCFSAFPQFPSNWVPFLVSLFPPSSRAPPLFAEMRRQLQTVEDPAVCAHMCMSGGLFSTLKNVPAGQIRLKEMLCTGSELNYLFFLLLTHNYMFTHIFEKTVFLVAKYKLH